MSNHTEQAAELRPPINQDLGRSPAPADDEIDLLELCQVIWAGRKYVFAITFCAALLAVIISLLLPNIYKAEVLLAPVGSEEVKGGGLASALGNLGGFAAMAGIALPGGGAIETNLAVLKSREFINQFIKDKELMPVLFADDWDRKKSQWKESDPEKRPNSWDGYRLFTKEIMKVSLDDKTSLVTVSVAWTDPVLAAEWANELVSRLNDFLRRQAILRSENNLKYLNRALESTSVADMRQTLFTLIASEQKKAMLANTQEEFALRVLDKAAAPDKKFKPKRAIICILATVAGGMFSVLFVLVLNWYRRNTEIPPIGVD
ncbi:polysaccharide chain length determinant protein [Desulfuromonas sp. DDH964]|nr:polysaccharide chain length determinant protein [Desulfuromonas sp. DDH964]